MLFKSFNVFWFLAEFKICFVNIFITRRFSNHWITTVSKSSEFFKTFHIQNIQDVTLILIVFLTNFLSQTFPTQIFKLLHFSCIWLTNMILDALISKRITLIVLKERTRPVLNQFYSLSNLLQKLGKAHDKCVTCVFYTFHLHDSYYLNNSK